MKGIVAQTSDDKKLKGKQTLRNIRRLNIFLTTARLLRTQDSETTPRGNTTGVERGRLELRVFGQKSENW